MSPKESARRSGGLKSDRDAESSDARSDAQDDAALMLRFGAGDDDAFSDLVSRHERGLLRFFYRRSMDRALAEDCVQEVFLRLVKHRGSWRPDAKFTTFLYRIAENHWIDRWRSKKAAPIQSSLDEPSGPDDDRGRAGEAPSSERRPEELAADRELAESVRRALDALPEEQRSVFVLAEVRGLKYADIAETLGVPVGTVKSRMFAATRKLQELLLAEGLEP